MTRSEAATGSLGLWSMEGTIDKAKLLYFGRLCRLHETLLTKKIFTERLSSYYIDPNKQTIGFIPDIIQILDKYSLGNYLSTYIEENTLPAKLSWTKIVYDHINEFEIVKWKNGMLDKDELLFYRQIHTTLKPLHLWEVARRNPLEKTSIATLVHIICGNTPMRFKSWLIQDDDNEERCKFCYAPPWNTSFHFITLCHHFNWWRNKWWDEIVDKIYCWT